MSRRDDRVSLRHMLDHARIAMRHGAGRPANDIAGDELLRLALVRALEVVGEAANRIPSDVQQTLPSIPWSRIINFRNRVIHGYDTVDYDVVERVIAVDLPPLIAELERVLGDAPDTGGCS